MVLLPLSGSPGAAFRAAEAAILSRFSLSGQTGCVGAPGFLLFSKAWARFGGPTGLSSFQSGLEEPGNRRAGAAERMDRQFRSLELLWRFVHSSKWDWTVCFAVVRPHRLATVARSGLVGGEEPLLDADTKVQYFHRKSIQF